MCPVRVLALGRAWILLGSRKNLKPACPGGLGQGKLFAAGAARRRRRQSHTSDARIVGRRGLESDLANIKHKIKARPFYKLTRRLFFINLRSLSDISQDRFRFYLPIMRYAAIDTHESNK
jgi:hypothetical protein